jgi:hypothetical protein
MTLGGNGGARVLALSTHDGLRCIKAQPKKDEVSCSEYNDSENKGNQSKEGDARYQKRSDPILRRGRI